MQKKKRDAKKKEIQKTFKYLRSSSSSSNLSFGGGEMRGPIVLPSQAYTADMRAGRDDPYMRCGGVGGGGGGVGG